MDSVGRVIGSSDRVRDIAASLIEQALMADRFSNVAVTKL